MLLERSALSSSSVIGIERLKLYVSLSLPRLSPLKSAIQWISSLITGWGEGVCNDSEWDATIQSLGLFCPLCSLNPHFVQWGPCLLASPPAIDWWQRRPMGQWTPARLGRVALLQKVKMKVTLRLCKWVLNGRVRFYSYASEGLNVVAAGLDRNLDHDLLANTDNSKEQDDKCALHAATPDLKPAECFCQITQGAILVWRCYIFVVPIHHVVTVTGERKVVFETAECRDTIIWRLQCHVGTWNTNVVRQTDITLPCNDGWCSWRVKSGHTLRVRPTDWSAECRVIL